MRSVGIEAISIEIPYLYVDQSELENHDKCIGKYTKKLGLKKIAVPSVDETVEVLAEKALLKLMTNMNLSPKDIGRLEVATESMTDRSKSIKSYLMKHLQHENSFIEGVDTYHACYAGTSALFSAMNWITSPWWNGKKAIVICTDITIGSLTFKFLNGAGAVALLIGNNPCLELVKSPVTSCTNEFDFYKPINSIYPVLDGNLSIQCYIEKLKCCLEKYTIKDIQECKYWVVHGPTLDMAKKASNEICGFIDVDIKDYNQEFEKKILPSMDILQNTGSLYTATLFTNLGCLLNKRGKEMSENKSNILCFAYGSGAMASLYILKCIKDISPFVFLPWKEQERNKLSIEEWMKLCYNINI